MLKKFLFLTVMAVILQARFMLDSDGNQAQVSDVIERAAPMIGAFVQASAMPGNEDRIISVATQLPPLMEKNFAKSARVAGRVTEPEPIQPTVALGIVL